MTPKNHDRFENARRLIVVSAPSGAGKTTLCARLLKDFPALVLSISSTTRAPRGEEKDGEHYHFLPTAEFEAKIQRNEFAEWARVHDYYYGTDRKTLEESFQRGKSVLLDIDVQGSASFRKAYPQETVTFFISPPSLEILEQRLRGRGTDSEETVQKRIRNAAAEIARQNEFHAVIINDNLDRAYSELRSLVENALLQEMGPHHG